MKAPLVSIIIPTYNRAHLIGETLDSVLAQTYTNWECIVVDDGSLDNTEEVLKKHQASDNRFKFHKRPNDKLKGANACRNYGFELSKGEYILFLDSDDFLSKNCLSGRIMVFKNNEDVNLVVANTSYFIKGEFKTELFNKDLLNHSQESYLKNFLEYKTPWTIMSVLWERKVIENVSFDERLLRLQDLDFSITALTSKKINIYRLIETDTFYRKNNKNVNKIKNLENNKKVLNSLKIISKKLKDNKQIENKNTYFKHFFIFILFKYFYPNYKSLKNDYIDIEKELYNLKELSFKECFFFKLKKFIYLKRLNKIDRRFIWQLNQYCDKMLNN
jgi:glycosyltransferase involved in cell wall biosynthesis